MGMLLEYKDDLWQVLKTQHVKPGKGGAFRPGRNEKCE